MLRPLTPAEFDRAADFAYPLALDPTRSGYPAFFDGVKTRQDFLSAARWALGAENAGVLLFEEAGEAEGWIAWYCQPEDRYFGTDAFLTARHTGQALAELADFAGQRYPLCDIWLGFPAANREAAAWLGAQPGFSLAERSFHYMLDLDGYVPRPAPEQATAVSAENYGAFRALHSQKDGDMFWNSARILSALERWDIWLYTEHGQALGALYCLDEGKGMAEIFGADFPGGEISLPVFRALLAACLAEEKKRGRAHICFMAAEEERAALNGFGFRLVGEYNCWLGKARKG